MASRPRKSQADAEARLVAMLRDGDPAALEALMAHYAGRVFRLAHGICRNQADAEEVVQDVFLTLFRKIDSFEGKSALWTWLFRVTTNTALIRRRGKRVEVEVSLDEHLPTWLADGHRAGDWPYVVCDWSQTPESDLLSGEVRAVLRDAIDRLPADYRAVVVLRDVEGLSNEEVADIVGESVACVKSRLHRARMALREQLTRHLGARR